MGSSRLIVVALALAVAAAAFILLGPGVGDGPMKPAAPQATDSKAPEAAKDAKPAEVPK